MLTYCERPTAPRGCRRGKPSLCAENILRIQVRVQEPVWIPSRLPKQTGIPGEATWTAGLPKQKCFCMAIPVLTLISSLCKSRPKYPPAQIHIKLAGINQDIFIRQWGEPDIDTTLEKFKSFFSLDFLSSIRNSFENDAIRVWIYEKMDMFVLFKKGRLVAHFKWSEFKERFKRPVVAADSKEAKPSPRLSTARLSILA